MRSMVRHTPSSQLRHLQREMDQLFESFLPTREGDADPGLWTPRADLFETDGAYHIELDVPGMTRDELNVNFQDGALTVNGERRTEARGDEANVLRLERTSGPFFRSFALPKAVDTDGIAAQYEDGVLRITVPKAEESKPRRISVH